MLLPTGQEKISLEDGELLFWPAFLHGNECRTIFAAIKRQTVWEQSDILIAGRTIPIPRLNAWYGEAGADYSYSGIALQTRTFYPELAALKCLVETFSGDSFNSALVNFYRDNRDSVDWHADDEPELGAAPIVASVSLGETRCFELRRKDNHRNKFNLDLVDGSLLLMRGQIQHYWQHRVGKEKNPCGERINITFRNVHNGS